VAPLARARPYLQHRTEHRALVAVDIGDHVEALSIARVRFDALELERAPRTFSIDDVDQLR
jgi:hypothetical protein